MKGMFNFRTGKFIAGTLVVFWIFFGEIASTFPFKSESEIAIVYNKKVPFTYHLNNSLSEISSLSEIDSIFTKYFRKRGVYGASVSMAKDGHLLYAKGFGYTDDNSGVKTEPYHLFRIASVSKLITAVAVMKLKEAGKLDVNEKVFGPEGILNDTLYLGYRDKRVEDITVQQLLNHTAGWYHEGRDPMFQAREIRRRNNGYSRDFGFDDVIAYVLDQNLNFTPGTRYSYSNFGYAVLGRVIEKKSDMGYEEYLNYEVFQPLGIYDVHLGKRFTDEFSEFPYMDTEDDLQLPAYNFNGANIPVLYGSRSLELLGAAGGWVASSPELIKLICAIDGFAGFPDILLKESIEEMTTRVPHSSHLYGWRGTDGWGTWWRTGTLSGSISLVMRFNNGYNWVVLINTSRSNRANMHNEISQIIYQAMRSVKELPQHDLFLN